MKTLKAFFVVLLTTFTGWIFISSIIVTFVFMSIRDNLPVFQSLIIRLVLAFVDGWMLSEIHIKTSIYLEEKRAGSNEKET